MLSLYDLLQEDNISNVENEIFKIIPELKDEKNFEQNSDWHCYDVWNHTVAAVNACDKNFGDRLVLLLHDIGKPFSYQDDGNIRHFRGHAKKSSEISKNILNRLNIPKEDIQNILKLIELHSTEIDVQNITRENKEFYKRLLKIQICDAMGYEKNHSDMIVKRLKKIDI